MESKKIISMLAMTAALVGCSQEEIAVVNNEQLASGHLTERPVLGDVVLGTGVSSRMALKDGSSFNAKYEEGDQIGACIIDEPLFDVEINGTKKGFEETVWTYAEYVANEKKLGTDGKTYVTWAEAEADNKAFYNPVDYISTNYPYTFENGNFYTDANLVEGNYMFYLPYDASRQHRMRMEVTLPQIQDCSDEVMVNGKSSTALTQFFAGEVEGFEKAMAAVGFKFLQADPTGEIKPTVDMEPLFAYPAITIKNNFNGLLYGKTKKVETEPSTVTMTIDSIQIYSAAETSPLFYKATIESGKIVDAMGDVESWFSQSFANNANASTNEILADDVVTYTKHVGVTTALPKVNSDISAANQFENVDNNHVTLVLGKELATGESYTFYSVLPAANYGKELKARVYATINGKPYMFFNSQSNVAYKLDKEGKATEEVDYYQLAVANYPKDYTFVDPKHGNENCVLLRGQQHPKAEYIIKDGIATGMKAFAGAMMTINLENTVDEKGNIVGAAALELEEITTTPDTPDPDDQGIKNNADFVSFMDSYLQNGTVMKENASIAYTGREEWTAGQIAFATPNTVVLDSAMICEIYAQVTVNGTPNRTFLTLTETSLGIGADVKVVEDANEEGLFTISTLGGTKSILVQFNKGKFGTNAKKLTTGINIITSTTATDVLALDANQHDAVVVLNGAATYAGAEGINTIYLNAGATLNVNAACDVMIIANGGNIVVGENGSLTNELNNIANATITNDYENEIVGTLTKTVVKANYTQWPTATISANSRINNIVVNPAITVEQFSIEQAQINMLTNLDNVSVELGSKIAGITTASNVALTKVVEISAAGEIEWSSSNTAGVKITSATDVVLKNIAQGEGLTFGANISGY